MKNLAGSKILVTGGTGFFANAICQYINGLDLNPRPEIVLLSRNKKTQETKYKNLSVNYLFADVAKIDSDLFSVNFDYVIHAATTSGTNTYPSGYLSQTIIEGTKKVLSVCHKQRVKGFLFVSSGAVYSSSGRENSPIKESDKVVEDLSNVDSYSVSKRIAEILCEEFYEKENIPVAVARCFTFSGEDMNRDGVFALTSFVKSAMNNKKIVVNGDGSTIRSYLDQRDLGRWLVTFMLKNTEYDILNVGSQDEVKIGDLAERVASIFQGCEVVYLKREESSYYVPSVMKARERYGLAQEISFNDSLLGFINRVKKHDEL